MAQQKITIGDNGATSMRVLDALTPINGVGVPAVNASYLGQIYIDETNDAVYIAKAVGSTVKINDWDKMVPSSTIIPLTGTAVPATNASFIGQIYVRVDGTTKEIYMAVAVGSETPANDWQEIAFAV